MEYFVISAKFVPLKYYTLSSQLQRLTSFSVGCSGRRILSPGQIAVIRKWSICLWFWENRINYENQSYARVTRTIWNGCDTWIIYFFQRMCTCESWGHAMEASLVIFVFMPNCCFVNIFCILCHICLMHQVKLWVELMHWASLAKFYEYVTYPGCCEECLISVYRWCFPEILGCWWNRF